MALDALFVCGSLVEGMIHYNRIATFVTQQQKVKARGYVYRLEVGYPVFNHSGDHTIEGWLLQIDGGDVLERLLDEFHGYSVKNPEKSLFLKTEIEVTLEDGVVQKAVTYSVNPAKLPATAVLIPDGDWQRDLGTRPPLTLTLTDRQKQYIRKLGASTGRDIVPINLDLYRELMGKGLIVDKGRRLALTRLGQEVFRFLE